MIKEWYPLKPLNTDVVIITKLTPTINEKMGSVKIDRFQTIVP